MTIDIQRAALKILRPHVPRLRSYAAKNPMPPPPKTRTWPTSNFVWQRYVSSMLTAMTRSSDALWSGLNSDPSWHRLLVRGPRGCPREEVLRRFLARHRVRFPAQKAARLRRAIDRDFERIAQEMRRTFRDVHDKRRDRRTRREAEVWLAVLLQEELAGCGVAPKIARLALRGADEITQVIPIDSRWQTALRDVGVDITPSDLADEPRYRAIEDAICDAAYSLGVRPGDTDGVGFGWIFEEDA